jgi:hypothetical protein
LAELADYAWLTSPEATGVLADLAEDNAPLHRQLERLRKVLSTERARLAVEQIGLRRRAAAKFGRLAGQMFFTDVALQQATDRWVACCKAERFPTDHPVTDLCSGIGGDLMALAGRGPAVGWERSPELALLAEANLRACDRAGEVRVADVAEHHPIADGWWHMDPDRRTDGRRSTRPQWHSPGPEVIEHLIAAAPHGAIKLAPATPAPQAWQEAAELEWISRDRECRQLVVWFGALARTPGQRRATAITTPSDEHAPPTACRRSAAAGGFAGAPNIIPPLAPAVGDYVYDTDPSIRAAGLSGALAAALELAAIGPGASYLTSDRRVEHPLVTAFRVLEVLPLRNRALADHLHERGVGRLEIKKRGVQTDPESLRQRLRLRGDGAATLLLARQGVREIAILAERRGTSDADLG